MPASFTYKIDRRLLERDFNLGEKTFKKEADAILREEYFIPAVEQLKEDFLDHKVTQELMQGPDGENISNTLKGQFENVGKGKNAGDDDSPPNLFTYIGFDKRTDPIEPILTRLDPSHPSGPKMNYKGKDKNSLTFTYEFKAPNEQVIYNATPVPWAGGGISWAERMEKGIPGIGRYLNVYRKKSRSGGAVQAKGDLPGRDQFTPVSYLTGLFEKFLKRVGGKR